MSVSTPSKRTTAVNRIELTGRLGSVVREVELPSGDVALQFSVVVDRIPPRGTVSVDTIDCVVWTPTLRSRVLRWANGDVVEVEGRLTRRFWRTAGGPASRYEVEVSAARRHSRVTMVQ